MKMKKNDYRVNFFYCMEDSVRLYQKTGWSNFNELWITDSTLNKGNSLINELKGAEQKVRCTLSQNEYHKSRNG